MRNALHLFIIGVAIIIAACSSNVHYEHSVAIPKSHWDKDDSKQFEVEIADTNTLYSIYVILHHKKDYMYSNLFLFSDITLPDSSIIRDTVECVLANRQGDWIGKGSQNISNTFMFKKHIRFPIAGTYSFTFQQAMRCSNESCSLYGIESLGLQIVK